ncbi:MAG TPA: DUF393 domain-containing protein [Phycisphaerales bacterium]|nr:DUF393 domain-containing protein [Phycisphaerales bacterium]HMP36144.1 DUF393 domain-containing protein [Phycisphaerales bacterium]
MASPAPEITLLYDGLCPLCAREIAFLRRRDRHGALAFVDIAERGFDPAVHGLSMEAVMGAMHGLLPDGRVVVGLEVFRRAYRAVGLGWVMAWTGWPILRAIAEVGYRVFARVRPRLSRLRSGPKRGRARWESERCASDRCSPLR